MIDRRKIAALLLVLGAGLAVVSSFLQSYSTVYSGYGLNQSLTTTLWIVTSEPATEPTRAAYHSVGWPVIIAAVLMVVAAVLMFKERTVQTAKPVAIGAAGALAGVVLTYVLQVRHEATMMSEWTADGNGQTAVLNVHGGMYLLVAGAVAGLVGAALAQRTHKKDELPQEEVVVHQLDSDDDTPPFGIAVPEQEQQETR